MTKNFRGRKKPEQDQPSPWYESNMASIPVSIIVTIIAAANPHLRWLLLIVLACAFVLIRKVSRHLGHPHRGTLEVFIFFFVPICWATYWFYQWLEPLDRTPQFLVRVYPFPGSPYKFPYSLYHLDVHNQNPNSVPVHDLGIFFHFKNVVVDVKKQVIRAPVGGMAIYSTLPDGSPVRYFEESNPELN